MFRLIRNDPTNPTMADDIAKWTNSQNPVKAEDFKANDGRQLRLHAEFEHLTPPWFYEHKRGVWATAYRGAAAREKYRDPVLATTRNIQMKDLGQACLAFLGDPVTAADKARAIFTDSGTYNRVFPEHARAAQLLLPYVLYQEANQLTRARAATHTWSAYLRYPLVYCVSRLLHEFLGESELRYLSAAQSAKLVDTAGRWAPELMDVIFTELADAVVKQGKDGVGARTVVRRADWLTEPYSAIRRLIKKTLEVEAAIAARQGEDASSLGLRQQFPLPISALA